MRATLFKLALGLIGAALLAAAGFGLLGSRLAYTPPPGSSVAQVADALIAQGRLPALAYAVIEGGAVTEIRALGVLDRATGEEATVQSLFEAASLSKPVIAGIAMRLADQGVIALDDPVHRRMARPARIDPEDDALWRAVTVRHLLSHASGLPNWAGDSRDPARTDRLTFAFTPGEDFLYSGEGYGLLLQYLAAATGRSPQALTQGFLDDLGMERSTFFASGPDARFARGHWGRAPGRMTILTPEPEAAFSLVTTVEDYARFLAWSLDPDVSPDVRASFRAVSARDLKGDQLAPAMGWSAGWGVIERTDGPVHFQWGDNGPFRSFAAFDAAAGDGIVYLTNGSFGTLYAEDLAHPVLGDLAGLQDWLGGPRREALRAVVRR